VDRHVAPVAHKISWAQTERLVEEAIARFMPSTWTPPLLLAPRR
jgi:hypothetical protein